MRGEGGLALQQREVLLQAREAGDEACQHLRPRIRTALVFLHLLLRQGTRRTQPFQRSHTVHSLSPQQLQPLRIELVDTLGLHHHVPCLGRPGDQVRNVHDYIGQPQQPQPLEANDLRRVDRAGNWLLLSPHSPHHLQP